MSVRGSTRGRVCVIVRLFEHGVAGRGNDMGAEGWGAAMDAAEGCPVLAALDGAPWREMLAGGLEALDLSGKGDAGLAEACATRYLARSASRLTRLDLRLAPAITSPHPPARPQTHTAFTYTGTFG